MKKFSVYACLFMAFAFTSVAHATGAPFFLDGTIVSKIPKSDRSSFETAVARVLNESPDGQTSTWTSESKRKRDVPVSVTMTPTQTVKTPAGRQCRFLKSVVQRNQDTEPWQFWFCRVESGEWRISTS